MRVSGTKLSAISSGGGLGNQLWDLAGERPTLDQRFANDKSLIDATTGQTLINFTRASSGTYVDSQGVIRTATTNLQRHSEDFTQGLTPNNATLTANQGIAPNGTITADQFLETTANGLHSQEIADHVFIAGATYTFSCYAKSIGERNFAPGFPTSFSSARFGFFNLSGSGSVVSTNAGVTASIQAVGDGWYRCSITSTCVTGGGARVGVFIASGTSINYVGDAAKGLLLWGAQLEQSSTVGEYIPTTSTINSAPRFDHAITSSVTNLLLRSEEFDNASWSKPNTTVTSNQTTAPDGSANADLIAGNAGTAVKYIYQSHSALTNGVFTFSVFAKAGTESFIVVRITDQGGVNEVRQRFNLSSGVVSGSVAVGGTATAGSSSINPVGNGWYRCVVTATFAAFTQLQTNVWLNNYAAVSLTTNFYVWGAQLEQSATAGEYVQTTTAPATASKTESLGLLVEEQRTNVLTASQDFSNVDWLKTLSTVSTDATNDPALLLTADKLVEDTNNGEHQVSRFFTTVSGTTYTLSLFVKAAGRTFCRFGFTALGFAGPTRSTFNLSTGAVSSNAGGSPTVAAFGNGWYRLSVTNTATSSTTGSFIIQPQSDASNSSYTGDGTSGIYIWGAQLEAGAFPTSYIPTTTTTVTRSADVASITGSNFGVSRTNLLLRSEEFDNAYWSAINSSISATDSAVSPASTTTADTWTINSASGQHYFQTASGDSVTSGLTYTRSLFVKKINRRYLQGGLSAGAFGANVWATFDLDTGAVVNSGNAGTYSITNFGNGWYRIAVTGTATATSATAGNWFGFVDDANLGFRLPTFTGNGTDAFFIWGAQLETGSTATAYIPTTTAAVTVFESSWYRQDEGSLLTDCTINYTVPGTSFPLAASLNDGTSNNRIENGFLTTSLAGFEVMTGGATQAAMYLNASNALTRRLATGYRINDFAASVNGGAINTDTSGTIPTVDRLRIGDRTGSVTAVLFGTIRRLTYWPRRLPNETLQRITQ